MENAGGWAPGGGAAGERAFCGGRPELCARLPASPSRPAPKPPPSSRLLNKPKDAPSRLALKVEGSLPLTQMAESPAPGLPPGRTGCLSLAPLPLRGGEPHWAGGIPLRAQPPLPQPRLQSSRTLHSLQRQNPLPWLNSALVHGFPTVAQRPQAPLGAAEPQFPTAPARVQHLEPHHHHNATVNLGAAGQASPLCPGQPALLWLPSRPLPSC